MESKGGKFDVRVVIKDWIENKEIYFIDLVLFLFFFGRFRIKLVSILFIEIVMFGYFMEILVK